MSSYQYDPFAPQGSTDEQGDINGIPEAFEDEVAVLMGMDATPSKSESNDPFSLDLLTESPTTDFIYEDKEDDDSPTKAAAVSQENNNTDDFVDDDDDDDGEKGRGFLSRLKNKIPEGMTTGDAATTPSNIHTDTNADSPAKQANGGGLEDGGNSLPHPETGATRWWVLEESDSGSDSDSDEESEDGLDDNGKSLPHPDEVLRTKKKKNKEKDEIRKAANQTLDGNGNSLPHPDEVLRTKKKKNKDKDDIREAANQTLDGNGNSLPHPDEVLRTKKKKKKKNKDKDEIREVANQMLDENGNSLPHPDEVLRTKKKKKKKNTDKDEITEAANRMLDDNGNSLPHPDEILRTPGTSMANANTTDEILEAANLMLDEGGNSLPHPETLMRGGNHNPTMEWDDSEVVVSLNDTTTPFLHDNDTSNSSSNNDNDNDQLLAALDAASESSDSEDDYYVNDTDDSDDDSNSNSNSDSDASRKELDENGNSLPHPETMFPNGSSHGSWNKSPSLRWGNLRTSLKSTFSKNTDDSKEPRSENENDGFSDEEQVNFTGSPSQRNYTDTNNTNDSFLDLNDNGNSLPNPETIFEENQRPKRKSALQLIQEVRKSVRSISSRHTNNTATPENDEERAYGRDNPYTIEVDVDSAADPDDDDFNDESNRGSQSKKEHLQTLLQEHRDNPRSRKICFLLVVIFVLFLALVIPLSTRNKAKNIGSDGKDPTTLPPALNLGSCDDEIVMTDSEGRDLKTDDAGPAAPCYTTEEPIFFRFKRCRPASPLDWVGVYPEGSIFLDRLWKEFYDGVYLCGGQPCPIEDPMNIKGASPRAQTTAAPPITSPGQYRFFLVKDSDWPYEYLKYTPSFQVVEDKTSCPSSTNNSAAADVSSPTALDELQQGIFVNVDLGTISPTAAPTSAPTKTFAPTATFAPTYYPTTLQSSTGTAFSF